MQYLGILIILVFFSITLLAQETNRKSLNVTIYNDNLGVIREIRNVNLKSGNSELRITDVAEKIDPTSVFIKFNGIVLEQNFQYDLVNLGKILQRYIDKEVTLIGEQVITGKLLSVTGNQIVLQKKDGGLIMLPDINKYQVTVDALPEGLITKPTLVWYLNSKNSGKQDIELSYQTSGMKWDAQYVAVLNKDDSEIDLKAWVSIENKSGASYPDANLKLVAGDINRVKEQEIYYGRTYFKEDLLAAAPDKQFEEKEFFEYHIYDLQRPTTLNNNEIKQISLFEANNVKITKKYLYRSGFFFSDKRKVAVVIEYENKKENNLGVPMPAGKVRMYKSDGKSIEFIGEDKIDHTPKDESIKLKVGDAFDIVAEEITEDEKRIGKNVVEYTYKVTLKNRKSNEDIVVEVERYLGSSWEILDSNIKWEKKNAFTVIFKVPVSKGKETSLKYKVRYSY